MKKTLSILFLVLNLVISAGCKIESKVYGPGQQAGNGNSGNNGNTGNAGQPRLIAAVRGPLKFRSMVESWIRQSEITNTAAINNIYTIFNAQKNQLPQNGAVTEMTSSALQAVFVVSAQVCGALKDKEAPLPATGRLAFKSLNFSPASTALTREALVSDQVIRETADSLLLTFLGRRASDEEKTEFIRSAAQVFLGVTITAQNNTRLVSDVAVVLCTAVLSSSEAISI